MYRVILILASAALAISLAGCSLIDCGCGDKKPAAAAAATCQKKPGAPAADPAKADDGETCGMSNVGK